MYDNDVQQLDIQSRSILIDLRDEAHRFAILHHRKARSKDSQRSQLESIPGVGAVRRKALMKYFKSVENIKKASEKELFDVLGNKRIVEEVLRYFKTS